LDVTARRGPRVRRGSAPSLLRDAAREVFAEHGYRATTREIAERAGVSHDLIFRYFDNKEKLFFDAVVTPLLDAVDTMYRHRQEDSGLARLSQEETIRRFTTEFYTFASENLAITRAMTHLFTEGSSGGELDHLRERVSATLASMVAPADNSDAASRTSQGIQMRIVMLLVGAVATFITNTYRTDDDVPQNAQIIDELADFIYRGLPQT
jgi:AcrR family transcriptional regulator